MHLPMPASAGITWSPGHKFFTALPTSRTMATPSLPPTAGRTLFSGYVPAQQKSGPASLHVDQTTDKSITV